MSLGLGRARNLPETTPRTASRRPTPNLSPAPVRCADVWRREVPQGVVNSPRIDGKDGVAGSIPAGGSTQALTSENAGRVALGRHRPAWLRKQCARLSPMIDADAIAI
jgi:hypothetical protein